MSYIDVTGKTEEEAIQNALAQLGMDRDDVSVEILERAKSGFLGMGAKPARVRVTYGPDEAPMEEGAVPVKPLSLKSPRKRKNPSPNRSSQNSPVPSSPDPSSPSRPSLSPSVRRRPPLWKSLPLPPWSCRSAPTTTPCASPRS